MNNQDQNYMRCIGLIIAPLLMFWTAPCVVGRADDTVKGGRDLEPMSSAFTEHTPEYSLKVRKILFEGANQRYVLRYLRSPSFAPESLLTITMSSDSSYSIQVVHIDLNLWYYDGDLSLLEVTRSKKKLPALYARRAAMLWKAMLLRARYQKSDHMIDGVAHSFFIMDPSYGQMHGTCTSPSKDTRLYYLTEIGDCLMAYAEAPPETESKILLKLTVCMDALEASQMSETD